MAPSNNLNNQVGLLEPVVQRLQILLLELEDAAQPQIHTSPQAQAKEQQQQQQNLRNDS